jgi:hypothetical protein
MKLSPYLERRFSMKKSIAALAGAVCAAVLLAPVAAQAEGNTVVVKNKSDWEIHQFYLSPADTDKWGPDQLGDKVIATGGTFTLVGIPCDTYDVKLIDEDEDECVVPGVDVCDGQQGWIISNDDLLACQGAGEEEEEGEE